jgi:hypothetical protein
MRIFPDTRSLSGLRAFVIPLAGLRQVFIALFALLLLSACAGGTMARLMPHIENMQLAKHYFGEPSSVSTLPDGKERNEWLLDRVSSVPGQYVEQEIFVGYDRSGFPVYYTRKIFVPEHLTGQFCRLIIIADKNGRTLESSWEGRSCDELAIVPSTY